MAKIIASLISCLAAVSTIASAQECSLLCPKRITNESNLEKVLEAQIKKNAEVNFDKVKVNVQMKPFFVTPTPGYALSTVDVLSGINLENSDHPDGLAWGVSGGTALSLAYTCGYSYRVTITTSGYRKAGGQKLSTRTESVLRVDGPATGKLKCS